MVQERRRRLLVRTACLIGLSLGFSSQALAECIVVSPKDKKRSHAAAIFAETLTKKEVISRQGTLGLEPVTGDGERFLRDQTAFGLRLTCDVRRVWNGPAPKTAVVYQVLNADSTDHWKSNTDYLIFASRLSDEGRSHLLLGPGEGGFIVQVCGGASYWTAAIEQEVRRAFGGGRKPE